MAENPQWKAMRAITKHLAELDEKGLQWALASIEEEIATRKQAQTAKPLDRSATG